MSEEVFRSSWIDYLSTRIDPGATIPTAGLSKNAIAPSNPKRLGCDHVPTATVTNRTQSENIIWGCGVCTTESLCFTAVC